MSDSPVTSALSSRARRAVALERGRGASIPAPAAHGPPAVGLVESLRHHLFGGETHYPARPGMPELRERLAARLVAVGVADRGPEGVLITASEGEALFVTLLGLGLAPGGSLVGFEGGRHRALFEWLAVSIESDESAHGGALVYRDPRSGETLRIVGGALHASDGLVAGVDDVLIGSLDAVVGMRPFGLGFVAAAPETVAKATKWKQASSICAPGPSQRAALWALGVRP